MPYAENKGLKIHYRVEGEGPALVLQHGSTSALQAWELFGYTERLKPHYQLVMIDARGHGLSDKPHDSELYQLPLRVSDVVAVLDALDIRQAHYWGYSMGGWIGFGMAKYARSRLKSLIIGGAHPYADPAPDFYGVDGRDPELFIKALESFAGVAFSREAKTWILGNDLQALAAAMHDRDSIEDVCSAIDLPCLLYAGGKDPRISKVTRCARLIKDAALLSFPESDSAIPALRYCSARGHEVPELPRVS